MPRRRDFYLFVTPCLLGLLLFQGGPVVASLGLSLFEWRPGQSTRWVGLDNYRALAADPLVAKTLLNTALYAAGSVGLGLALSLGVALLARRASRGASVLRSVVLLPAVSTGVATTMVWAWIFNSRYGAINQLLGLFGVRGPAWLAEERWALPAIVVLSLWGIGGSVLVYLAGLRSIPRQLYEAARLDGAGSWQEFRYLTLPLLAPVTLFLTVAGTIGALQVFTPAYVLTRGGPNNATLTTGLLVYLSAFQYGDWGLSAALGWVLCAAILAVVLLQFRWAKPDIEN